MRMGDVDPGRANMVKSRRVFELKARKDVVLVNSEVFGDVSVPYLDWLLRLNSFNGQSTTWKRSD